MRRPPLLPCGCSCGSLILWGSRTSSWNKLTLGHHAMLTMMVSRTQTHLHQPWRLDRCSHSFIHSVHNTASALSMDSPDVLKQCSSTLTHPVRSWCKGRCRLPALDKQAEAAVRRSAKAACCAITQEAFQGVWVAGPCWPQRIRPTSIWDNAHVHMGHMPTCMH